MPVIRRTFGKTATASDTHKLMLIKAVSYISTGGRPPFHPQLTEQVAVAVVWVGDLGPGCTVRWWVARVNGTRQGLACVARVGGFGQRSKITIFIYSQGMCNEMMCSRT